MSHTACYPDKAPRVSQLMDVLSHHLRREVLHFFENYTDARTVAFDDLVSHLESRVPGEREADLEVRLVHTHLPKLAQTGWIDYDRRTGEIRYHGHDRAEDWLRELHAVFSSSTQHDLGATR